MIKYNEKSDSYFEGKVEFKNCSRFPKFFVSKDGRYIIVKSKNGKLDVSEIKEGTRNYNKEGYPVQVMVSTGERYKTKKGTFAVRVINLGRLVLLTWVGESKETDPEGRERCEVDHINRNPFDNRLENLRWVSREENCANKKKINPVWCHTEEQVKYRNELAKQKGFANWGTYIRWCRSQKKKGK